MRGEEVVMNDVSSATVSRLGGLLIGWCAAAAAAAGGESKRPDAGPAPFDVPAFIAGHDKNKDGSLERSEVPEWMVRPFDRLDGDGDGLLSKRELDRVADRLASRATTRPARGQAPTTRPGRDGVNTPPARGERRPERLKAGDVAPDFTLPDPTGKQEVALSDRLRAKRPVVLVFCSYTCPPFRGHAPAVERLHQDYKDRASFLLVYIREAHPGSVLPVAKGGGPEDRRKIEQTSDLKARGEHATICQAMLGFTFPAVVDRPDDAVNAAYAGWPIRLVIVGADGRVAYPGAPGPGGFRPAEVREWLERNTTEGGP